MVREGISIKEEYKAGSSIMMYLIIDSATLMQALI